MELNLLEGKIIGIVTNMEPKLNYEIKKVKDIIYSKVTDSLKMVNLDESILLKEFKDLSVSEKNKVILASLLNEKVIVLYDFSKGMTLKELNYYKKLFKKITQYNRKIILIGNDMNFYLNLVDHLYVIEKEKIIYETTNLTDSKLYEYVDCPEIIKFVNLVREKGINMPYYLDFNDLLKAIYRLKS